MDKPSEGANRDVFLWKVLEQFGVVASLLPKPFAARPWEDGEVEEKGWKVRLDVWSKEEGEDDTVLRLTAYFDDAGAERAGWDEKLRLVAEWQGEETELLVLGWKDSAPDPRKGLNSPADYVEGEYAIGKVTRGLRADVMATLKLQPASASRELTLPSRRGPPVVIDTAFEPVQPIARAERVPEWERKPQTLELPAGLPIGTKSGEGGNAQSATASLAENAAASIIAALAADLPPEFRDTSRVFRAFIHSHAQANGNIDPDDLIAFTQDSMEQMLAFSEAYLHANSPMTAAGVQAQGIMLTLGVIAAAAGEATTSAFGLGHILGTTPEMLPFILGSSVVFGGALLPLTENKPPAVRRGAFAAALAFGAATATFAALNPDLDDKVQPYLPGYHAIGTAPDGATLEMKLAQTTAAYQTSLGDTEAARGTVKEAGTALLQARRKSERGAAERLTAANKSDVQAAQAKRDALQAQMIATQKQLYDARENHWTRRAAQGLLLALFALVNGTGPVVINFYLSKREAAHKQGTAEAQRDHIIAATTHNLKVSKKTQTAKARIILAAMRVYYTSELQTSHGLTRAAAEEKAQSVFASLSDMATKAAEGFRATQQAKARRPFFRLPFRGVSNTR